LLAIGKRLVQLVDESNGGEPPELTAMAEEVLKLDRYLKEVPAAADRAEDKAANVA
jgi:hypothetical protein